MAYRHLYALLEASIKLAEQPQSFGQRAHGLVRAAMGGAGQAIPLQQQGAPTSPAPGAGAAPAAPAQQYKITGPGGVNLIVAYIPQSKGWAVYNVAGNKASLQPGGGPFRTLADAFAHLAGGL